MMLVEDEVLAKRWLLDCLELDTAVVDRLELFLEMLREENGHQNLVSTASLEEIWSRHIVDSAQLLNHVPRETRNWLDLGTGAGFPGLIIAVLNESVIVTMVESRGRRVEWLERCKLSLGLDNARIIGSRLEAIEAFPVDAISARAFAPLGRLVELAARFSTSDTHWVLPKGRSAGQELAELTGWNHAFHVEQSLTDADAGIIVGTLHGKSKGRAS